MNNIAEEQKTGFEGDIEAAGHFCSLNFFVSRVRTFRKTL